MQAKRKALAPEFVASYGEALAKYLIAQWLKPLPCRILHTYLPIGQEVSTLPLVQWALAQAVTVVVPQSLDHRQLAHWELQDLAQTHPDRYGTLMPTDSEQYLGHYDVILVPGLAFDPQGYRLGYGAGYYDQFLASHPNTLKIGLAYPFQMVAEVPHEPHDTRLNHVVALKNPLSAFPST